MLQSHNRTTGPQRRADGGSITASNATDDPSSIIDPFCLQRLDKHLKNPNTSFFFSPVVQEDPVPVDLVLQGEVEGEVLDAFAIVDLHPGGVLVGLKVLDDVREPNGESVEPEHNQKASVVTCDRTVLMLNLTFESTI